MGAVKKIHIRNLHRRNRLLYWFERQWEEEGAVGKKNKCDTDSIHSPISNKKVNSSLDIC